MIYWGSYLVFGLLVWAAYAQWWWLVVLCILYVYMRWVEPQWIAVREYGSGKLKIAVVSDLHLGAYKGRRFLERVVRIVNDLRVDVVLLPGDFVYAAGDPEELLAPLRQIEAPMYGVLGNHDLEPTGEFSCGEMYRILTALGVEMIDNRAVKMGRFDLVGIGSLMAGDDRYDAVNEVRGEVLVLAHNPDCAHRFKNKDVKMMICGHTHGGQIRVPWLYKKVIPCDEDFDTGLHMVNGMAVFVSGGLGEVVLPLRMGVRPEIVVLNV